MYTAGYLVKFEPAVEIVDNDRVNPKHTHITTHTYTDCTSSFSLGRLLPGSSYARFCSGGYSFYIYYTYLYIV